MIGVKICLWDASGDLSVRVVSSGWMWSNHRDMSPRRCLSAGDIYTYLVVIVYCYLFVIYCYFGLIKDHGVLIIFLGLRGGGVLEGCLEVLGGDL